MRHGSLQKIIHGRPQRAVHDGRGGPLPKVSVGRNGSGLVWVYGNGGGVMVRVTGG